VRIYTVDVETAALHPITPEGSGTRIRGAVSPDGKFLMSRGIDGNTYLSPVAGGVPQKVPGLRDGELALGWTPDGKAVYVGAIAETESSVFLINLASGRRRLVRTLAPSDKAGLTYLGPPEFTPDGRYYVYSYNRQISELFVAEGIR
jgi:Tol biopolymer transport system component